VKRLERRVIDHPIEVRTNEDGTFGVSGYAAVYDSAAHGEVIKSSAFKRSVRQKDDVKLLVNHDGVALARTKSGTMALSVDETGLRFDVPSLDPANPDVQRLVSAMSRGDIDQCSFAGYFLDAPTNKEGLREVREVELIDVSIVTHPWYSETSAGLTGNRNVDRELMQIRAMPEDEQSILVRALVAGDEEQEVPPEETREEVEAPPVADDRPTLSVEQARSLLGLPAA
jgi:HK97 family phage prohead protease